MVIGPEIGSTPSFLIQHMVVQFLLMEENLASGIDTYEKYVHTI